MNYLARPVFTFRPDFKGVTSAQVDDHTFDSQGSGGATPWKVTGKAKRTVNFDFLFSLSEIAEFRAFVADRAGRRRGFWLPLHLTEFAAAEDVAAGESTIVVPSVDHPGADEIAQFQHVFLSTRSKLELYAVDSISTIDGEDVIDLADPLATDLVAADTVIGGLLFVRLVNDDVSLDYLSPTCARVRLQFVELPEEYETAEDGEQPIYLYEITRGSSIWRYANYGVGVTIGANTFDPQNITHADLIQGIEFLIEGATLNVATDSAEHPLRFHVDSLALAVTNLRIFEIDGDDVPGVLPSPIYTGRLGQMTFGTEGKIGADISSAFRIAETNIPRPSITRRCMHRLGDEFCTVVLADFTTAGTVDALGATYVEASEFGAKATAEGNAAWFVFGVVRSGEEIRFCTGQAGDRLYLNAPFRSVEVGDAITAQAGCDKKVNGDCLNKFDNVARHVGFYYTPNQNPTFKEMKTPLATGGKK